MLGFTCTSVWECAPNINSPSENGFFFVVILWEITKLLLSSILDVESCNRTNCMMCTYLTSTCLTEIPTDLLRAGQGQPPGQMCPMGSVMPGSALEALKNIQTH